jgi:hypothetical protein
MLQARLASKWYAPFPAAERLGCSTPARTHERSRARRKLGALDLHAASLGGLASSHPSMKRPRIGPGATATPGCPRTRPRSKQHTTPKGLPQRGLGVWRAFCGAHLQPRPLRPALGPRRGAAPARSSGRARRLCCPCTHSDRKSGTRKRGASACTTACRSGIDGGYHRPQLRAAPSRITGTHSRRARQRAHQSTRTRRPTTRGGLK